MLKEKLTAGLSKKLGLPESSWTNIQENNFPGFWWFCFKIERPDKKIAFQITLSLDIRTNEVDNWSIFWVDFTTHSNPNRNDSWNLRGVGKLPTKALSIMREKAHYTYQEFRKSLRGNNEKKVKPVKEKSDDSNPKKPGKKVGKGSGRTGVKRK